MLSLRFLLLVLFLCPLLTPAFVAPRHVTKSATKSSTPLYAKKPEPRQIINDKRRKQLGLADDEDEYDLYYALDNNTDPLITKIIAGSLIVTIIALLVAGVIVPSLTDFGDGVCSPIQNGGRC